MNPYCYFDIDDNDDFNGTPQFKPKDNNQKQSNTINKISNTNNDDLKFNEQHRLFAENMKQCQQIFSKKIQKHNSSNIEQPQIKNIAQTQNQKKFHNLFQPLLHNNIAMQRLQNSIAQTNNENPLQNKITQIKIEEIQENFQQKKSHTLEICSVCLQPKETDHQCNDEYGLISCPYCSDHIVRNFLNDHLIDCIPYIEHQFQTLDKVEECSICMEDLVKNQQTLNCTHSFHKSCIDVWKLKSKECPVCRKPI
ncbi:unnamed protein product [Paramecium sonneborni]|uniref:RING-type domain-containing protein n=1 Tax=Paramecium sonneborni TaxID=65129 RepID=A0A8S1LXJ2_9CILI|nr:unnamed protein product [Paramecium sonneborni]